MFQPVTLIIIQRASATGPYIAIWRGDEPKNAHTYRYSLRNELRLVCAAARNRATLAGGWAGVTIYPQAVQS